MHGEAILDSPAGTSCVSKISVYVRREDKEEMEEKYRV